MVYDAALHSHYIKAGGQREGLFLRCAGAKIPPMPNPVPPPISNTFYIAGNIIFDLATGEAKNVLTLVNKPEDASIFTATDAQNYLNFVQLRAQNIVWTIEHLPPLTTTPLLLKKVAGIPTVDRFIIKGVQYV
jgi:hypothetical protein